MSQCAECQVGRQGCPAGRRLRRSQLRLGGSARRVRLDAHELSGQPLGLHPRQIRSTLIISCGPREARMPRFTKEHLFHIRPVGSLVEETHETGHELKRAVSSWQLTAMGVGAIIGTGIFVVIGEGAAIAGPAVILSFALAALACVFSALSYAELA